MFHLFSLFMRSLHARTRAIPGEPSANLALLLNERANSSAGQNPRHAQELRDAAGAWMRVIR